MLSAENLEVIESEGLRILEFARRDPGRIVPQYPSWRLRDLVAHCASIHARTTAVCETRPDERIPAPSLPDSRDPLEWFDENLARMIVALRESEPTTHVWFFGPDRSIGSWERRMVVETGMHRWDAQQAFEEPEPLLQIVAGAGLDEFDAMWFPRLGALPPLAVTATDLGRSWKFGDGEATATVTGTASDVYLRLMARAGVELPKPWANAVDGLASPAG
jgi:uncharacterized protein (TIGR03083 family)